MKGRDNTEKYLERQNHENTLSSFLDPPIYCRPHTRWWWMGNAALEEDITWQLEQMREQGIGGVEQITMQPVYRKGNVPYLSDRFFELVKHAIEEARRLGMEFSLNFGGPGWVIGGDWLPPEDRSMNMVPTWTRITGSTTFSGEIPIDIGDHPQTGQIRLEGIDPKDELLAMVAARVGDGVLQEDSLLDLTGRVDGRSLEWEVPDGQWQLMAFWLKPTGQGHAIDHFNKEAMERYCKHLGGRFREEFGEEFGKTVESFFVDSFEVALLDNGIYWSRGLLDRFRETEGYDLVPYLPAIWWEVGEISPRIRYDVNHFLHRVGLEAFFSTFLDWCQRNGVRGRIQPYGFTTDIIEGAGMTHIPEMEITAGEKDTLTRFDTRIGPKKYVSSGAHIYGRNVVSVEAYTYLHWESYRGTLEELKIASDMFLRSGANKFYNHGYSCTPERETAPSRRFQSEVLISHPNVWWKYYRRLSDYLARCCHLLRQGSFVADIAVYSPLASQWTEDVLNARSWPRGFEWGELGRLLIANGYDFDLVNDDSLVNLSRMEKGTITINETEYSVLILPNIRAMPLETLKAVRDWVEGGGKVVALERVPEASVGMQDWESRDREVRRIVEEMFDLPRWRVNPTAPREYGRGKTYHIHNVIDRSNPLDRHASVFDPFLNVLREHVTPDMGIDFLKHDIRENRGITHIHRRTDERDIYFVANVQDRAMDMPLAFRVTGKRPTECNPVSGEIHRLWEYREEGEVTRLPISLPPYGSTFIVFEDQQNTQGHVTESTLDRVIRVNDHAVQGIVSQNGIHGVTLDDGSSGRTSVEDIPPYFRIEGDWQLLLKGKDFPETSISLSGLGSWTEDERTKHFSGTGRYEVKFDLPVSYLFKDLLLDLDLGSVGDIAEVELNGIDVGVRWMRGQTLDITEAARPGTNSLVVKVTNTLINRVSGLEEIPPVPDHLKERLGGDAGTRRKRAQELFGYQPLPPSGLMGPVTIQVGRKISIDI